MWPVNKSKQQQKTNNHKKQNIFDIATVYKNLGLYQMLTILLLSNTNFL